MKTNEILKLYEGKPLGADEYLLKLRTNRDESISGFLTKLTKKGEIPVAFDGWGGAKYSDNGHDVPIYVFEEHSRKGWKLEGWRFGKSRNWALVLHPEGFVLEIYMEHFLEMIKEIAVINGELVGEFKWTENILVK